MSLSRISVEKDMLDIAPLNGIQSRATAFDPYFIQTELEVIQSQKILDKVVDTFHLTEVRKRLNGGKLLTEIEDRKILEKAIDIPQFRKTSIIELGRTTVGYAGHKRSPKPLLKNTKTTDTKITGNIQVELPRRKEE